MIELILPYPPSVNRYKNIGRIVTSKKGKIYQKRHNSPETVAFYYQVYMLSRANASKFFTDGTMRLQVTLTVRPPDNRRSDIDNRIKITLDSLERSGIIVNDYQIARLIVQRESIIEGGQLLVQISELGEK